MRTPTPCSTPSTSLARRPACRAPAVRLLSHCCRSRAPCCCCCSASSSGYAGAPAALGKDPSSNKKGRADWRGPSCWGGIAEGGHLEPERQVGPVRRRTLIQDGP